MSAIKHNTEVTLKFSSNVVGESNDENNTNTHSDNSK